MHARSADGGGFYVTFCDCIHITSRSYCGASVAWSISFVNQRILYSLCPSTVRFAPFENILLRISCSRGVKKTTAGQYTDDISTGMAVVM